MAGELAKLFVVIGAKFDDFKQGLQGVKSEAQGFSGTLGGAFSAILPAVTVAGIMAGIGQMVKATAEFADNIDEMSQRVGVSTQALQAWDYAARKSGADLKDVEVAMKRMAVTLTEAFRGSGPAIETFQRLGLSVRELSYLSPEDQFRKISEAIAKIPDPTVRAAAAVEVFGRSGTSLLPMISNLTELEQRAVSLGIVLSVDQVAAANRAQDAFEDLGFAWEGLKNQASMAIFPALTSIVEALTSLVTWLNQAKAAVDSFMASWGGLPKGGGPSWPSFDLPPWMKSLVGGSYAAGGVVPGPIGQPVPVIAHGGEKFLGANSEMAAPTINIYNPSLRSDQDIAALTRQIAREFYKQQRLQS